MIDINELTPSEIDELDREIKKYKKSVKNNKCYRITFDIIANPELKRKEEWISECLNDSEDLSDNLNELLYDVLFDTYDLKSSEKVNLVSIETSYL